MILKWVEWTEDSYNGVVEDGATLLPIRLRPPALFVYQIATPHAFAGRPLPINAPLPPVPTKLLALFVGTPAASEHRLFAFAHKLAAFVHKLVLTVVDTDLVTAARLVRHQSLFLLFPQLPIPVEGRWR